MPEFLNHNNFTVHLVGPDGHVVRIRARQRITLDEYFVRYVARGSITRTDQASPTPQAAAKRPLPERTQAQTKRSQRTIKEAKRRNVRSVPIPQRPPAAQIVGRKVNIDATQRWHEALATDFYPISNGIGVGILSYNRLDSLQRLVESIRRHTDLHQTTIFISDDGSTDERLQRYLAELAEKREFVVLPVQANLGIAGNSNRLLRCLSRFKHCLLLNDDVEVLANGWDSFYAHRLQEANFQHFIHRQPGIYGATKGTKTTHNGVDIWRVDDKPQGAVLAFTADYLATVGYFDESIFGQYGSEHVDWSSRAAEFKLQPPGFYDVDGSDLFFRLHNEQSAVEDRIIKLRESKAGFAQRQIGKKIQPGVASQVPSISYVVPCRNLERADSIRTVIDNIRAQRYPAIAIILSEQDNQSGLDLEQFKPCVHKLVTSSNHLFNKSKAFNWGVSKVTTKDVVLHDADTLIPAGYTEQVAIALIQHESCHLCSTVIYATKASTARVNEMRRANAELQSERVVGYFEGGSLACSTAAYWSIGGFNEDYQGYGCEDCDFYLRLKQGTKFLEKRTHQLLHLWHPRTEGWEQHHDINRKLQQRLDSMQLRDRIAIQRQQLQQRGYGEFLRTE